NHQCFNPNYDQLELHLLLNRQFPRNAIQRMLMNWKEHIELESSHSKDSSQKRMCISPLTDYFPSYINIHIYDKKKQPVIQLPHIHRRWIGHNIQENKLLSNTN